MVNLQVKKDISIPNTSRINATLGSSSADININNIEQNDQAINKTRTCPVAFLYAFYHFSIRDIQFQTSKVRFPIERDENKKKRSAPLDIEKTY